MDPNIKPKYSLEEQGADSDAVKEIKRKLADIGSRVINQEIEKSLKIADQKSLEKAFGTDIIKKQIQKMNEHKPKRSDKERRIRKIKQQSKLKNRRISNGKK
jgi:hypothetical protein